jgi:hypothetical protein
MPVKPTMTAGRALDPEALGARIDRLYCAARGLCSASCLRPSPRFPPASATPSLVIDVMGLSYREAARTMRVREATITTRLCRGRESVARALS